VRAAPAWTPPGPVAEAFVAAEEPVAVLMGPVRSGKTTAGLMRGLFLSYRWPETRPGVRRFKFGVLRRQMVDLERTTIPSWTEWFPRTKGAWRGARGEPQTHELRIPHPKGGLVELTVEFRGIGEMRLDEALRGWEPSAVFVDECDTMPENTFGYLLTRVGSYPRETLERNPKQVWGCCNAPELGNWVLRDLIDAPHPAWRLYRQPSGLSAQAENLGALGADWYRRQAEAMPDHLRRRFVENIPGLAVGLALVYPEFNPELHVAAGPLAVLRDRPVIVGLDAGGTPAASLWQIAPNGQRRCFAELSTHERAEGSITGPRRFGEALARLLGERCRELAVHAIADPSAQYGGDAAGEGSWIEIVARVAGIEVRPAGTNDPTVRLEALRAPMNALIDGRLPALLVCPGCRLTTRALARDYRYPVTAGRRGERPLKNWASHLVEAAQYALMDGDAVAEITARRTARHERLEPAVAAAAFNPF
jgi:hypothetical protein